MADQKTMTKKYYLGPIDQISKRSEPGSEKNNGENNPHCFAYYHCRVFHRRCAAAIRVPSRAERYHLSTTGGGIRAGKRFSQVGGVESVGKDGSHHETNFRGAPAGTGGVYSWSGNKEVGEARMTITESRPNELIRIRLDFFKPFAATSIAEFTFKPEGNHTAVTWSMERRQDLHGQGHPFVYEHGQHDRQPVRKGSGGHESCGGSNGEGITEKIGKEKIWLARFS
jgi:hypothetical protein